MKYELWLLDKSGTPRPCGEVVIAHPVYERLAALDWGLESLRYLYPTQVAATVRAMRGTKGMVN